MRGKGEGESERGERDGNITRGIELGRDSVN